ncbi:MAG: DUF2218 domain-containing protein [Hyphomicrobiales bacterium]|nr:DUF2218 domain-containing protein [Hyphomicrobiales bacterium]
MDGTKTVSAAAIATPHAQKYLVQLCKHFQHKRPATWGDDKGKIEFTIGDCDLAAEPSTLHITASATSAENLPQLEDVIARHLLRFAFREELKIEWKRES